MTNAPLLNEDPRADAAEQAVLGICLASPVASGEATRALRVEDFYLPVHQVIFAAIDTLNNDRKPIDTVSVWSQIQSEGNEQVLSEGPVYLHSLYSVAPPAAALTHHIGLVKEAGARRQLASFGILSQSMATSKTSGSAAALLETLQDRLNQITSTVVDSEVPSLQTGMEEALTELERLGQEGVTVGIPSGFPELDTKIHGFRPGQMIIVAGRPAMGKALALDTVIPTPYGWTTMEAIEVGEVIYDTKGQHTTVTEVFDILENRECFLISFGERGGDGGIVETITADADHLWPILGAFDATATTRDLYTQSVTWACYNGEVTLPIGGSKSYFIKDIVPVDSVPVRCIAVDSTTHSFLATEAFIPTHNSTVMLDFVRHAVFHHSKSALLFSLEMSRMEVLMRCLSAQARVELTNLQTGKLTDEEWERIARAQSKMDKAILGIDDSPGVTVADIRAKARAWQNRYGLDLIAIDYIQLMNSARNIESRQQEVSEISRNIKLIAKEFKVPVLALSQLNRGSEQRTDKRPMLSDLRESGCIPADTKIWRADTGGFITMGEIMENGYKDILVWSMDDKQKLVPSPIVNAFSTGIKEVYEVTTTSGRVVKTSGNHPFYTMDGWVHLEDLSVGARIATPRSVPEPVNKGIGWNENRLGLLAHMIGDGCVLKNTPVHYVSEDEENLVFIEKTSNEEFGITTRRVKEKGMNWTSVYQPSPYPTTHKTYSPISGWFRELGIFNLRSHQKLIPDILYSASNEEIAVFLGHLWATDGTVVEPARSSTKAFSLAYSTNSRELADGVLYLLQRLGIYGRLQETPQKNSPKNMFYIFVNGIAQIRRFHSLISINGIRQGRVERGIKAKIDSISNVNCDTIPMTVWSRIEGELSNKGMRLVDLEKPLNIRINKRQKGFSRERFNSMMAVLDYPEGLSDYGTNDLYWDEIQSIKPLGPQEVYDITVDVTHNFIAQGIILKNSLEQDSDLVMLIHRDEVYNPEQRVGEADIIIAKQRAGPIGTVPMVAQLHYSRFVPAAYQVSQETPPDVFG